MGVTVGEVIEVGSHRVVFEKDFYFITFHGDVTVENAHVFNAINRRYFDEFGYLMCLGDAHKVGTMAPAARRLTAELSRELNCPGATAIFGANLIARTLATLVLKAIAIGHGRSAEMSFFKTEAESRRWLDEQRPDMIARSVKRKS